MRLIAYVLIFATTCTMIVSAGENKETHLVRAGFYCFDVPRDYVVVETGSWVDAWYGYMEPADRSWRVTWGMGLVQKLFKPNSGKRIIWQREEEFHGQKWLLGLVEDDKDRMLVIGNGEIELRIPADTKDALEILRRIGTMVTPRKEGIVCMPPERQKP